MFPALLLALAGTLPSPGSVSHAQLEVLEGRASLAATDGVLEVRQGMDPRVVGGPGYLEVAPLSRVSIRWRQTGSLVIRGPASFEWENEGERLTWRFHQVGKTHLEVRSADVRLYLPGGWVAAFENGASFLRGRSNGGVELHHDAGLPVLLRGRTVSGHARPPWTVLAGAKLLLGKESQPGELRGTRGRMLAPYGRPEAYALEQRPSGERWSGFSWPWRPSQGQTMPAHARTPHAPGPVGTPPEAPQTGLLLPMLEPLRAQPEPEAGASPTNTAPLGEVEARGIEEPPSPAVPAPGEPTAEAEAPLAEPGGPGEPGSQDGPAPGEASEAPSAGPETLSLDAAPGDLLLPPPPAAGTRLPEGEVAETVLEPVTGAEPETRTIDLGEYVPPARLHPWLEFTTHIRKEGELMLTPYGVRWRERRAPGDDRAH